VAHFGDGDLPRNKVQLLKFYRKYIRESFADLGYPSVQELMKEMHDLTIEGKTDTEEFRAVWDKVHLIQGVGRSNKYATSLKDFMKVV
jgi:hypothetical protein